MAERRERDLEEMLRDVGARIAFPPERDLLPAVRARIETVEPRGSWLDLLRSPLQLAPALATLALLVVATLAFQPIAGQAAEALGLRGITIFRTPPLRDITPGDVLPVDAERVASIEIASERVGFRVRVPEPRGEAASLLGEPEAIYVRSGEGASIAWLFYGERTGIPVSIAGNVSVLITEVRGGLESQLLGKGVGPDSTVTEVEVNGRQGVWIEGAPHTVFYRAPNGDILTDTIRLAGNVLLWEEDGLLMRIEAQIPRDQALRIARSIR